MTKKTTSTGGAATNRGIWYQALWIVLQAARSHIGNSDSTTNTSDEEVLRLVLEPNGGDVRIEYQKSKRVVQLKVKSHGAWALKDFILEVLPDLYRAVDINDESAIYEFVTEGKLGRWEAALTFFKGLGARLQSEAFNQAYAQLSADKAIPFVHKIGDFWKDGDDTEKGLFDRVVDVLRGPAPKRGKPDKRDPLEEVQRKAWHLLARLSFSGGHSPDSVRREVENALLKVVSNREQLPQLCDAMGGWISKRSSSNDNTITPSQLFEAHKLQNVIPISDLLVIRRLCREKLTHQLSALGYESKWDVRRSPDGENERISTAITAFSGGSGEGKSWRVYAAADSAQTPAVVFLVSSGDIDRDFQQAASDIWEEIIGHDTSKPLVNIGTHLREVLGAACDHPWLTLCIDQLGSIDAVNPLLRKQLEDMGVNVVLGCEEDVATRLEQQARKDTSRISVLKVGNFSTSELHHYLQRRIGDDYARIPADIRDLLKKPLLASIYCDLVTDKSETGPAWRPRNEYELVDKFWQRIDGPETPSNSTETPRLLRLAAQVLDGSHYPWKVEQLDDVKLEERAIWRLIKNGWLRRADRHGFEIPHDRLLANAVARSLIERCETMELNASQVVDALVAAEEGPHSRKLGYLMMDWFHLATCEVRLYPLAQKVLVLLGKRVNHMYRNELHGHLLPTLGTAATPLLTHLLRESVEVRHKFEIIPIVEGLAQSLKEVADENYLPAVLSLLEDERPKVRHAGMLLLEKRPAAEAIDVAWKIHKDMQADPITYGETKESAYLLYQDSFSALRASTRANSSWLEEAIRKANPEIEPVVDLAYLIANLKDGRDIWSKCKNELIAKVPSDKTSCLSTNIGLWRDSDEMHYLEQWVQQAKPNDPDFAATAALRAIVRIEPKRVVDIMHRVPSESLFLIRDRILPRLLLTVGDEISEALFGRISQSDEPLREAQVYDGNANCMDAKTLGLLLDALEKKLEQSLKSEEKSKHDLSYVATTALLSEVSSSELLDIFAARKGTPLQDYLAQYLTKIIGPILGPWRDNLVREPLLIILLRVNPEGFVDVLREYLSSNNIHAKNDVIEWAKWYADASLLNEITEAAVAADPSDKRTPFLQSEAAHILAGYGDFSGLLKVAQGMGITFPLDIQDWIVEPLDQDQILEHTHDRLLESNGLFLQGSLLVLGLLRSSTLIEKAPTIVETPSDDKDCIAAIRALGYTGTQNEKVIDCIASRINQKEFRAASTQALLRLGTKEAMAALKTSISEELALYLASKSESENDIVPTLAEKVSQLIENKEKLRDLDNILNSVLCIPSDEIVGEIIRSCDASVHEYLREMALALEGRLWFVASKYRAIRGLSIVDPEAARLASAITLENRELRDRSLYPSILYRLDPNVSVRPRPYLAPPVWVGLLLLIDFVGGFESAL